jgi:hypothetical protein
LKYFERGAKGADLLGKTRKKFFRAFAWRSEKSIFEGEERGKLALRKATLDCKVLDMTSEQWTKAKSLYLAGKTWGAIASDLKLNQSTLLSKASREGLPKVRKEMRNTISSKENVSLESLSALVRSKLAADAASTLERIDSYDLDGIRDESTREQILGSVAKRSALVFGWSETGEQASVSINLLGSMPDRITEIQVTGEPDSK